MIQATSQSVCVACSTGLSTANVAASTPDQCVFISTTVPTHISLEASAASSASASSPVAAATGGAGGGGAVLLVVILLVIVLRRRRGHSDPLKNIAISQVNIKELIGSDSFGNYYRGELKQVLLILIFMD